MVDSPDPESLSVLQFREQVSNALYNGVCIYIAYDSFPENNELCVDVCIILYV